MLDFGTVRYGDRGCGDQGLSRRKAIIWWKTCILMHPDLDMERSKTTEKTLAGNDQFRRAPANTACASKLMGRKHSW